MLVPDTSTGLGISSTMTNTLYSVKASGTFSVVTLTNSLCEAGSTSTNTSTKTSTDTCESTTKASMYPVALFPTKLYVFMAYVGLSCDTDSTFSSTSSEGSLVALERASGNLYCIPGMKNFVTDLASGTQYSGGFTALSTYYQQVQTDSTGKIIWINPFKGGACRVDFTEQSHPTVKTLNYIPPANPNYGGFSVNAEGDAFFGFGSDGDGGLPAAVQFASGLGYFNVTSYKTGCVHVSTVQTNDFRYMASLTPGAKTSIIFNVPANTNFTPAVGDSLTGSYTLWNCQQGLVQAGKHSFLSGMETTGSFLKNVIFDIVEGGTRTIGTHITLNALSLITRMKGAGDYLYILGSDLKGNALIVSYGPISGTPVQTTILGPGAVNYTVDASNFDVSSNGDITFQGTSNASGSNVLVTIPAGTVYTSTHVINSTLPKTSQIIKIN
jgi:hypothetical protein